VTDSSQPEIPAPWKTAHRAFLDELRALADDADRLATSLGDESVEHLVNAVLARTCEAQGLQLTEYLRHIEHDPAAQRQLDAAMRALLQAPVVLELRRPAQLEEIRRELLLLRYALSGEEPPAELWRALEPAERIKVQSAAQTMRGTDDALLERVRKAIERGQAFGTCAVCEKPIPVGRLQLVAAAERCAPCQALHDGEAPVELPPGAAKVVTFQRGAKP